MVLGPVMTAAATAAPGCLVGWPPAPITIFWQLPFSFLHPLFLIFSLRHHQPIKILDLEVGGVRDRLALVSFGTMLILRNNKTK
jgi:hypothetical protein